MAPAGLDALGALLGDSPYDPEPAVWVVAGDVGTIAAAGRAGVGAAFEPLESPEEAEDWTAEYEGELRSDSARAVADSVNAQTAVFLPAGDDADALVGLVERVGVVAGRQQHCYPRVHRIGDRSRRTRSELALVFGDPLFGVFRLFTSGKRHPPPRDRRRPLFRRRRRSPDERDRAHTEKPAARAGICNRIVNGQFDRKAGAEASRQHSVELKHQLPSRHSGSARSEPGISEVAALTPSHAL